MGLEQRLTSAHFQATKGRFGCARNHLVRHLLQSPGASLATPPEMPVVNHPSGLALRFPRITRIRRDKSPADIDTLSTARRLLVT
jgi:hypothetical protein